MSFVGLAFFFFFFKQKTAYEISACLVGSEMCIRDSGKKESFKKAGIEYTINQIDQYRACGVDGIHLYALNKYDDVAYIAKAAGLIDLV